MFLVPCVAPPLLVASLRLGVYLATVSSSRTSIDDGYVVRCVRVDIQRSSRALYAFCRTARKKSRVSCVYCLKAIPGRCCPLLVSLVYPRVPHDQTCAVNCSAVPPTRPDKTRTGQLEKPVNKYQRVLVCMLSYSYGGWAG